jgi:hypothetical protein
MTFFIVVFGALTFLAGIAILANPENVFGLLRKKIAKIEIQILAVAIRLVLGIFLVYQSGDSKYPFVIEIIGWLSVFAAVIFAVIGRSNFINLMSWALLRTNYLGRIGGLVASAFGGFLIHAFI